MAEALITLDLPDDVAEDVKRELVQWKRDAVSGCDTRDKLHVELDQQLNGRLEYGTREQWQCRMNSTISEESHIQFMSMICATQRHDPQWEVVEVDPADANNATLQEAWLSDKFAEYELGKYVYNLAYNTGRTPTAPLYVGWRQHTQMKRVKVYRDAEFPNLPAVDGYQKDPNRQYEEELRLQPEVVAHGCEFRTPDASDCYMYPPGCQSIKQAMAHLERQWFLENELWQGVKDSGYDFEAVERIVALGPSRDIHMNILRDVQNQYDGVSSSASRQQDGFYECFLGFGVLPKLWEDGEPRIPEHYLFDTVKYMICGDHVFQLDICEYSELPYIEFGMHRIPNRQQGKCLMQIVAPLHDQASFQLQNTIDSMNIQNSPCLIGPVEFMQNMNAWSVSPGGYIPEEPGSNIRPLEWGNKAERGLELVEMLTGAAQRMWSAAGIDGLDPKRQRKNGEIEAMTSMADTKFDLFLQCFQEGMAELAARIVALHMQFEGDNLSYSFQHKGQEKKVTAENMRGKYRYIPTGTSTTMSVEQRQQQATAKVQVQQAYFAAIMQMPPQVWPLLWHGVRTVLTDMGERQPEQWIGPQPTLPAPPPQVPPELLAMQQAGITPPVQQQVLSQGQIPPQYIGNGMQ